MKPILQILLILVLLVSGCGSPNAPDVPDTSNCFKILDIIKSRGQPLTIDIYNQKLYVADNRNGLAVFDISTPTSLNLLHSIITPERATVVRIEPSLNALFISTSVQTYIYFLDSLTFNDDSIIGDADCRQILTDVETGTEIIRVIKADGNDGIQVSNVYEDVNDDEELYFQKEDMKSLNWSSFIPPSGLAAINDINILAVGLRDMGVGIADVSNATSENAGIWLSSVNTPGEVFDVAFKNGYIYAADGYFGLTVINASDINNPELITSIPIDSYIHISKVVVFENHLVLLDEFKGIVFFDITVPDSPVFKGDYEVREPYDATFDTSDGLFYLSSMGEGITVFQLEY